MVDVLTPAQRKYCMSRIRGKDTKPEIVLRKLLWAAGYRYRLKNRLPGRPDIIFPGSKLAIFIDGCFWHGCPKHAVMPKTNRAFWRRKLYRNMERDREVNQQLRKMGWRVVRLWEHQVDAKPDRCSAMIVNILTSNQSGNSLLSRRL